MGSGLNLPLGIKPAGEIRELFVFVAEDPEGNQSVGAFMHPTLGVVMMITGASTPEALEPMRAQAMALLRGTGAKVHVRRFIPDATLETLEDPKLLGPPKLP